MERQKTASGIGLKNDPWAKKSNSSIPLTQLSQLHPSLPPATASVAPHSLRGLFPSAEAGIESALSATQSNLVAHAAHAADWTNTANTAAFNENQQHPSLMIPQNQNNSSIVQTGKASIPTSMPQVITFVLISAKFDL